MVEMPRPSSHPLGRLGLLAPEVLVPDRAQADLQALAYWPESSRKPNGGAVRGHVVADEVHGPETGLVDAQVRGGDLDHPLLKNIASVTRNEHR